MPTSYEQTLPPAQQLVYTSNIRRLERICRVVVGRRRLHGYSTIVVTTGPAGSGKTIAAQYILDHQAPRAHTSLPGMIRITLTAGSTRRMQAVLLATELKESISGNQDQIRKGIKEAIHRNDLELILLDEADLMTEASFDLFRQVHDETGCLMVILGLPKILSVIRSEEKFVSRVGYWIKFDPLPETEILNDFLPQLMIPRWQFDPRSVSDIALGKKVLELAGTSLRKITNLLWVASDIAGVDGLNAVTIEAIQEACRHTLSSKSQSADRRNQDLEAAKGFYEALAESRQAAKKRTGNASSD